MSQKIQDATMIQHIREELERARSAFPDNKHQLAALGEEVGELNQALLENQYGEVTAHQVYWEAVQVAAMAIRVATEGDSTFDYDPIRVFEI